MDCPCTVVGNNNAYLGLHAKLPIFLPNFSQIWTFQQIFIRTLISHLTEISPVGIADTGGRMDWRTAWYHFTSRERFYSDLMQVTYVCM